MGIQKTSFLKGQVEILSAVLIVGITIAAMSVAYLWGVPLIQKGESSNQIQSAEALMQTIDSAILDVVQSGGQRTVAINVDGPFEVSDQNNAIIYSIRTKKVGVASTEWTPMNEGETFGVDDTPQNQSIAIFGSDKPGVIIARASVVDTDYITDYRLVYRELDDKDTGEGQLIKIAASGNNKLLPGSHSLLISRDAPTISPTQTSKLGGALVTIQVYVALS